MQIPYRRVDTARIALLEGRLHDTWACLDPSATCAFPSPAEEKGRIP